MERISGDQPAYVFFNNDPGCAAVTDAATFATLARRHGDDTTRAPGSPDRAAAR